MADASNRFDVAAHNVANLSTEPFSPLRPDGSQGPEGSMDLASELVEGTMLAPAAPFLRDGLGQIARGRI